MSPSGRRTADRSANADRLERFGRREISFETVLVIGRSGHLNAGEQRRLRWRNDHVTVHNKKVICLTFDVLLNQFAVRLATLGAAAGLPDVAGGV